MKTKIIKYFFLGAVIFCSSQTGISQISNKDIDIIQNPKSIVGGTPVVPQVYPWMASIVMTNTSPGCGATLINPNWVLTAGHCTIVSAGGLSIDKVIINSVIRNPFILEPFSELIEVDSIFTHPGFNFTGGVDLALLHLDNPSSIAPIELADESDSIYYAGNMPAKVLGWGLTSLVSGTVDSLREANCIFVSNDTCAILYSSATQSIYGTNPGGQICAGFFAGDSPGGAAAGDSGGPLFFQNPQGVFKQVGVVSGGNSNVTTEDYPGVFTLIPKYLDWIDNTIAEYELFLSTEGGLEGHKIEVLHHVDNQIIIKGLNQSDLYSVSLIDISGRIVFSTNQSADHKMSIPNISQYLSGVYLVSVSNHRTGSITTEKIIIK